jgi:TonB family protein
MKQLHTTLAFAIMLSFGTHLMAEEVKRVSTSQATAAATTKAPPEYSPLAKQLRLQGPVEMTVYISEKGTVEKTEAVSGNPVLCKAADEALRKWKFTPFTDNGTAVKAVATVTFNFKM